MVGVEGVLVMMLMRNLLFMMLVKNETRRDVRTVNAMLGVMWNEVEWTGTTNLIYLFMFALLGFSLTE